MYEYNHKFFSIYEMNTDYYNQIQHLFIFISELKTY